MNLIADYHNHPLGHDPNRKYSFELFDEWLKSAQERKLQDVMFTDHDRYHPGVDFDVFYRYQEKLPANIKFKLGIELDNDPETSSAGRKWVEQNYEKLDFILGSVHFIDDWAFDHPNFKDEYKNWDINKLYKTYFKRIQEVINSDLIDGLAHLDLIKIFGHRPTVDMTSLYRETLELAKKKNLTIEISTAGLRKPVGEIYPSEEILKIVKELGLDITVSSDAHSPNHLAENYDKSPELIKKIGFERYTVFSKHQKEYVLL